MRIPLKLRRNLVGEFVLRGTDFEHLIRRQRTFSWLTEEESFFLEDKLD
jgi:hypothetical protein